MRLIELTEEYLQKLEGLYGAATPGPWTRALKRVLLDADERVFQVLCESDENATANADFIAESSVAVPIMIKEIRRLRKCVDLLIREKEEASGE